MALHLPSHSIQSASASPVVALDTSADGSLFASAETTGWRVWDTASLKCVADSSQHKASYSIVLPFYRSNLVLLVGGPPTPRHAPNKLIFWDEAVGAAVYELEFGEQITGLATRHDRLVVALTRRAFVLALGEGIEGVWQEAMYETALNRTGLVALSTSVGSTLLTLPGRQPGHVQLVRLPPLTARRLRSSGGDDARGTANNAKFPATSILVAHTSPLSALCCTPSGHLVATASAKGTLVRLWDPATSQLVRELRRGTDPAQIFSLALRSDGGALAVSSDKGTVHVWQLNEEEKPPQVVPDSPKRVSLSTFKPYLPRYFSSEWSHSQFRLPPPAVPVTRFSSVPDEAPTIESDVCTCVWLPPPTAAAPERVSSTELRLLTRSGGSFRLTLQDAIAVDAQQQQAPGPTALPQAWGPSGRLKLEEYRRWGGEEGWE